jgi:hypothetical protein
MTNKTKETITVELDINQIIKDNLVIVTGVSNGKEWKLAGVGKTKAKSCCFEKDLIRLLEHCGCQEISVVK